MTATPTDIHPDLKLDRLEAILRIFVDARGGAWERQDYDFGDDAQILGIRAYKSARKTLEDITGTEGYEWLKIIQPKARLTLQIGDVLLRVWREDDPEAEAEDKRMMVAIEAYNQLQLFPTEQGTVDRWGLIFQTDNEGLIISGLLAGYDSTSRTSVYQFPVSIADRKVNILSSIKPRPEAVILERVKPSLRKISNNQRKKESGI